MNTPNTQAIREVIRVAKDQEADSRALRNSIEAQIPLLHNSIKLPKNDATEVMVDFVERYISHVPNFLDAIAGLTREAGIFNYASIFLNIARDFFLKPPELIGRHSGLAALLDQAYLTHRLIEEINDRVIARYGLPLAPMDMTRANLLVHQLIGEPYANELDFAVLYSTELHLPNDDMIDSQSFKRYVEIHKARGWGIELDRWPCLAEDLSINVNIAPKDRSQIIH